MFKKVAVLVSCAFLFGCGVDLESENQEIVSNLIQAGFPAEDIMIADGRVYVGRDAHVTLQASREMLQPSGLTTEEQYRTTNLITTSVTKICINPTSTFNSYSHLSTGLDWAIMNYNALGLTFTMVRGPTTGCSANIAARTTSGTGGSSGYPSGGLPYGAINIGTGLQSYSYDVNEHVITHELGHCLGLRHTDYYDHSISCGGTAYNEGAGGVGALLIPGTLTVDPGSIMNTCFDPSTATGEFSSRDIAALQYLY